MTNREQAEARIMLPSWVMWSAAGLVTALLIWLSWPNLVDFVTFVGNRKAVTAYLQGFGLWGPALLVFILSLQVVFAVVPGHILMIAGGYLYGFGLGLFFNLLGTVVASQLAFVVVRQAGRPLIKRLLPVQLLDRWDGVAKRQGLLFFLLFFWFPVVPSNVMNFVAAISSISFRAFLVANVLGRLPGVVLVTLIGSHGLELSTQQWLVIGAAGLVFLVTGRLIANKLQQHYFPAGDVN